jgi:hypothetical protein
MTIAAILLVGAATLSWIMIRRCPLAKAISRQIDQIAASSPD